LLEADATFEKYGIDSLVVTEILGALERDFGSLPSILMMDRITIGQLADYFVDEQGEKLRLVLQSHAGGPLPELSVATASHGGHGRGIPQRSEPTGEHQRRTVGTALSAPANPPRTGFAPQSPGEDLSTSEIDLALEQILNEPPNS
jgi:rhizoxin synthesis polyketide synthase RhiF